MGNYDDIINLPHHEPKNHPRMSMWNRAAQFAPFAALTGYDDAISDSNLVREEFNEMGDFENEELNRTLADISSRLSDQPSVTVEYFEPDQNKAGGFHKVVVGTIRKIDEIVRIIEMTDGRRIPIDFVRDIKVNDV
jgi:hypothetical protein